MLEQIFENQRKNRWILANSNADDRKRKLVRLRDSIQLFQPQIIEALHADFGKPESEVLLTEIFPALQEIQHVLEHLHSWMQPKEVPTPITLQPARSEIYYEARGLVLILSPWNYPFNLSLTPLIEALAAGNSVILKPSEKTPNTSEIIKKVVEYAFPEGEAAVILGDANVAEKLTHMPFDHIFFTGNTQIGKKVMAAAAANLASVTLELGGKSPTIVLEDADVVRAARRITWAKFLNAGQTCIAPDYVYVHRSVKERFLQEVLACIYKSFGANPKESKDLARIVDQAAFQRLATTLEKTIFAGAQLRTKMDLDASTRYLAPTVLENVSWTQPIMQTEIFGPIMPVLTFDSPDEVIAQIRTHEKPLALYIYSNDRTKVDKILAETSSGGVCVNNSTLQFANHHLPFGGVNASGIGSYHGHQGFRTFSHEKSVLKQNKHSPIHFLMPPYSRPWFRWLNQIIRLLTRS